jgi:hypothetical protein
MDDIWDEARAQPAPNMAHSTQVEFTFRGRLDEVTAALSYVATKLQTEKTRGAWKKLTREKVLAIRAGWKNEKSRAALAAENEASLRQVRDVISGRTWGHIS